MTRILDIQRMSSEDGPGLRTTAFLKGCTLGCAWCHNPESISPASEVLWHPGRCMACSGCVLACPQKGISLEVDTGTGERRLSIERLRCLGCFSCVQACPTGAVEAKGSEFSIAELADELLKDRAYFGIDGGVTLSGGEALMQPESIDLLRLLRDAGVSIAIDTCGQIGPERLDAALELVDVVLYDLKLADNDEHRRWTGVGNEMIVANFGRVVGWAAGTPARRLWIRTPIIPGATDGDENIVGLARLVKAALSAQGQAVVSAPVSAALAPAPAAPAPIERWELAAFNNLCVSKYESLESPWAFADVPLVSAEHMAHLVALAREECPGLDIRATGATATGVTATGAATTTAPVATTTSAAVAPASFSTPVLTPASRPQKGEE